MHLSTASGKRLCYAGLEGTLLRKTTQRPRKAAPFEAYCGHAMEPLSGLVGKAVVEEAGVRKKQEPSMSTSTSKG